MNRGALNEPVPTTGRPHLAIATMVNEASYVIKAKRRLKENRDWVRRRVAGEGRTNSAQLLRRRDMIREDEELLVEWGVADG
jgi:hypothetical protein